MLHEIRFQITVRKKTKILDVVALLGTGKKDKRVELKKYINQEQ